jgi:hypothetical protein
MRAPTASSTDSDLPPRRSAGGPVDEVEQVPGGSGRRYGVLELVAVGLAVLAALLVVVDAAGPLRAWVVVAALLVLPGAAARPADFWRLNVWARWSLVLVISLTIETLLSLVLVWTALWYPRAVGVALLLVSAVVVLVRNRREAAGGPAPDNRATTTQPRSGSGTVLLGLAGLLVPLVLWLVGLAGTRTDALGSSGLLGAFPVVWYLAVLLNVVVLLWRLLGGNRVHSGWLAAHLALLVGMLYGSAAFVESVPRLPWVYKHIAVTRYIELHGSVNPDIDIYQRWPGFFAWTAQLGALTGYLDPVRYAQYFEVGFALLYAILVLAIARTFGGSNRWSWTVVTLFSVSNWVAQNYYAPQAFAYTMSLLVGLLVLLALRTPPRRLGTGIEDLLARVFRAPRSAEQGEVAGNGALSRSWVLVAIITTFAAIVATHQLTPYLMLIALVPLFVLGYLRPLLLVVAMVVIALAYLIPNLGYIQSNFGLFSGFDPLANATFTVGDRSARTAASVWQGRGTQLISVVMLLLAATGLVRRVRAGFPGSAALVGWLLVSPAFILLVQSYGGEGRLRVFLFALPWISVAAAWAFWPDSSQGARVTAGRRVGVAAAVGSLCILFVLTYFQPEADYRVPRTDVVAAQWLDSRVAPGDVVLMSAQVSPALIGPNYDKMVLTELSTYKQWYTAALDPADITEIARSLGDKAVPRNAYLVFSDSQTASERSQQLYAPGELSRLESELRTNRSYQRVYDEGGVRIYRLSVR